jgi:hypothetical protein
MLLSLLQAVVFAGVFSFPTTTQGVYRTEKLPQHGIEIRVPRRYETIPAQPTEVNVVRKWFGRPSKEARGRYDTRPHMYLIVIPKVSDPDPEKTNADRTQGVVNSFPRFFGREFPVKSAERRKGWDLKDKRMESPRKGFECFEYDARFRSGALDLLGRAYCLEDEERIVALFGYCPQEDFKKQSKMWKHIASKLELSQPKSSVDPKWERYYERRKKFKDPTFRAELRSNLARGWKADDTENFIFLYSTTDEKLIRILKRELEAIRKAYLDRFPPYEPIRAVSAVRICKDRDEYIAYGGSSRSAGYWNAVAKELVFYDQGKGGDGRANSRIVLYHEAFHQYIYYCAGEVAPHSWYNEGHGDYFSGTRFNRAGEISKIGYNTWRVGYIKRLVERNDYVPLNEILFMEKAKFYKDSGRCYAQAWSIIYFLRESKVVRKHPRWKRILPQYFQTLRDTFEEELEERAVADPNAPGPKDAEALAEIKKKARDTAMEKAFDEVDIYALEDEWAEYVRQMDP